MNKKLKYINWSTAIFPGFYDSMLYNSDTLYNIGYDKDSIEYDFVENGFEEFTKSVAEQCVDALFEYLGQGGTPLIHSMKFAALHSPRFYNFETDKLEIEIDCDWPGLVEYAKNSKAFDEYLQENFTSCSGFISFVPNNSVEFFNNLEDDFERLSQVIIEFYILQHLDKDAYEEEIWAIARDEIFNHIAPVEQEEQETETKGA